MVCTLWGSTMIYYVNGFMFNQGMNQVLLLQKSRPDWMKGLLNGIGGHVELNENPEDCMVREFKEETGIETQKGQWHHFLNLTVHKEHFVQFYYLRSEVLDLKDYQTYYKYVKSDEPVDAYYCDEFRVVPNLRWIIPMIIHHEIRNKIKLPIEIEEE